MNYFLTSHLPLSSRLQRTHKMSSIEVEEIIFTEEDRTLVVNFMNCYSATFKLADPGDVSALSTLCTLIHGLLNRTVADLADSDARDMLDLVQKLKNRYHAEGTWLTDLEANLIATINIGIRQRADLEVEVNRIKSEVARIRKAKDALKLSLKRKKNALEEATNKRANFDVQRARYQSRVLLPISFLGGLVAGNITSAGQLPPGVCGGFASASRVTSPVTFTVHAGGHGSHESGESQASGGVGSDGGRSSGHGSQKSGAGGKDKIFGPSQDLSDDSVESSPAVLFDCAVSAKATEAAAGGAGDPAAADGCGGEKGDRAPNLGLRL